MNEERTSLKMILGVLAVLAMLGAVWRIVSYQPGNSKKPNAPAHHELTTRPAQVTQPHPQTEKMQELLAENPTPAKTVNWPTSGPGVSEKGQLFPTKTAYPVPNRTAGKRTYPTQGVASNRYVDTNFYSPDTKTPTSQLGVPTYQSAGFVGPQANFQSDGFSRVQEERASMLAPYLRPNRQEKARMDAQWNKLAAALERAIAKALMPKSKQAQGSQMQTAQAAGAAGAIPLQTVGFDGPLAPVGEQLALQKRQMMQQMGHAFGQGAAQQTGNIMDSYAGEIAAALQAENSTPEQKEQQVKQITKKYQDKMDKLAEKNQYDKYMAQRTAEMNEQKEAFRSRYDAELSAKLGQNLEEEWQEEQKLAMQNLPMDEYNTRMSQLHQTKRNERHQLVSAQGKSINPLLELEKQREEKALKELKEKVANGEIESVTRKATPNEMQQMQTDLRIKSQDTLDRIAKDPLLGPQAAAEFKPILDTYQARLNQLYQQELSIDERQEQEAQLLKGVNRQLLDKQIEYIEKSNLSEAQKQKILEDLSQAYNSI